MKTKIYLKNAEDTRDIKRIETDFRLHWRRSGEDDKGTFIVFDVKLEKDKLKNYPNILDIEYLE